MILSVNGLSFSYPAREVLHNISFGLEEKECLAILGTNGTGKSTLLKCLTRILKRQKGTVVVDGKDYNSLTNIDIAKNIGYVAQHHHMLRQTVFDAVLMGRKPYIKWDATKLDSAIVNETIEALGMSELAMRFTDELSGGEMQKVVIARAIAQQPKVLLMDEPTSNLDMKNQFDTIRVIREIIQKQHISVIVTMHDINLALRFADKFLLIKKGEIYAAGGPEIINRQNISDVYGIEASVHLIEGHSVVIPSLY